MNCSSVGVLNSRVNANVKFSSEISPDEKNFAEKRGFFSI